MANGTRYTVIDSFLLTKWEFSSIVPAMKKFIAAQNAGKKPYLMEGDRRMYFRTSPAAARRAGYTEKQIFEQFADPEVIES